MVSYEFTDSISLYDQMFLLQKAFQNLKALFFYIYAEQKL